MAERTFKNRNPNREIKVQEGRGSDSCYPTPLHPTNTGKSLIHMTTLVAQAGYII